MPYKDIVEYKEYQREYYRKNREHTCQRSRTNYHSYSDARKLHNSAKQRARERGYEFDIEVSDIIIPERCPILDEILIKHTRYAPSINRKDSTKDYTKDNIWVISRRANTMKNDASLEDLRKFAKWILKN